MPRSPDGLRQALRFFAIQLPGLIGWALALVFAVHHGWIGRELAAGIWSLFLGFDVVVFLRSRHLIDAPPHTGVESMAGTRAVALTPLAPGGFVQAGSERWRARLAGEGSVEKGAELRVEAVRGLELIVRRVDEET